jgi:hypothetical protein
MENHNYYAAIRCRIFLFIVSRVLHNVVNGALLLWNDPGSSIYLTTRNLPTGVRLPADRSIHGRHTVFHTKYFVLQVGELADWGIRKLYAICTLHA